MENTDNVVISTIETSNDEIIANNESVNVYIQESDSASDSTIENPEYFSNETDESSITDISSETELESDESVNELDEEIEEEEIELFTINGVTLTNKMHDPCPEFRPIYAHFNDEKNTVVRIFFISLDENEKGETYWSKLQNGLFSYQKPIPEIQKLSIFFSEQDLIDNHNKLIYDDLEFQREVFNYMEWKATGLSGSEEKITLNNIKQLSSEALFKIKLELFEEAVIQECESVELRANLRKSNNLIELFYHYQTILNQSKE